MIFRLATTADEPELRALLRHDAMPGAVRVEYRREPDFFAGLAVQGQSRHVVVAEQEGRIVGMGCRAVREAYVNGRPTRIGYLSGLRSLQFARGGLGLARGYRFLRRLDAADPVEAHLTTIMTDNAAALALLESGRGGLPRYRPAGELVTYAIPVRPGRLRRREDRGPIRIVSAAQAGLGPAVKWINAAGAARQFFPVWRETDFGSPLLSGLAPENLFLACRNDRIVGAMAGWDQSAFKQFVAAGYAAWLRAARPLANAALRLCGLPPLPPPGTRLPVVFAAWHLAERDDPAVTALLLRRVLDWAGQEGAGFCVTGFVAGDPGARAVPRAGTLAFRSRIYLVDWEQGAGFPARLDGRPLYLEAAVL